MRFFPAKYGHCSLICLLSSCGRDKATNTARCATDRFFAEIPYFISFIEPHYAKSAFHTFWRR